MKNVTIYTTPVCVYCKMAKDYFNKNNITYIEKDVTVDVQARDEMVKKTGQLAVPVISVDHSIIVGFDRPKLGELLGIK